LVVAVPIGWLLAAKSDYFAGNISSLVNGSLWTLSWEAACYVAAGLLGAVGVLTRRALPAFFAAAVLVYITHMADSDTFRIGVSMLMLFLVGGYVAVMGDEIPLQRLGIVALLVHTAIVIQPVREALMQGWASFEFAFGPKFSDRQILTFVHLATYPFIVLWIGMGLPRLVKLKTDLSYGVYIYAWPLQQAAVYWMRETGHPIGHPLMLFGIVLLPLFLLSYLSWMLIERPALGMKRRSAFAQTAQSAVR
ncbi:MAG TPA: hypothetical protein DC084_28480, partial [Cupriavidus sp.]|nr:hypothetical protein [Cupriavidus sp.]